MKRLAILFLALPLMAENFGDIVKKIDNSYLYKISKNDVLIAKKALMATKALNRGGVDLSYSGVRFFETPKMKLTMPTPIAVAPDGVHLIYENVSSTLPLSESTHFIGEIKYSYPIFSGYKITNAIKAAKIKLIQSKLKLQNTKRVLILNAAKLYSGIYTLNAEINALVFEKKALKEAKEKALALFNEGLVDKSAVDDINAKYYEVIAKIEEVKSKRDNLQNSLNALLNISVKKVGELSFYPIKNLNAKNRPDVKEVAKNLDLAEVNVKIQKSAFYPEVGFEAALKKEADNLFLSENKHQNIDKSYLGIGIKWNIYSAGADSANLEMAKIQKLNALLFYKNYLNKANVELKNDLREIKALKLRLKAASNEIKARSVYYEKIKAKFNEGLADSVDLNDAIARLAAAKAKKEYIKSQIFFYTIKANLDGGMESVICKD